MARQSSLRLHNQRFFPSPMQEDGRMAGLDDGGWGSVLSGLGTASVASSSNYSVTSDSDSAEAVALTAEGVIGKVLVGTSLCVCVCAGTAM